MDPAHCLVAFPELSLDKVFCVTHISKTADFFIYFHHSQPELHH